MNKDRIVKHRFFIVDIEKEQEFIDSYREKGYKLESVNNNTGRYVFKKADGEFIPKVRIDYHEIAKNDEYQNYISMFEDAGWKLIRGSKIEGTHYFEQVDENTSDELFSDNQSLAGLYKRLYGYTISWMFISLALLMPVISTVNFKMLFENPKELYYTPGLWEMKGTRFLSAFLFETPFVMFRNGAPFLLIICIVSSIFCAIKVKKKEKQYSA
jgi:hypothetical protein